MKFAASFVAERVDRVTPLPIENMPEVGPPAPFAT
jgi:hypothetical protein